MPVYHLKKKKSLAIDRIDRIKPTGLAVRLKHPAYGSRKLKPISPCCCSLFPHILIFDPHEVGREGRGDRRGRRETLSQPSPLSSVSDDDAMLFARCWHHIAWDQISIWRRYGFLTEYCDAHHLGLLFVWTLNRCCQLRLYLFVYHCHYSFTYFYVLTWTSLINFWSSQLQIILRRARHFDPIAQWILHIHYLSRRQSKSINQLRGSGPNKSIPVNKSESSSLFIFQVFRLMDFGFFKPAGSLVLVSVMGLTGPARMLIWFVCLCSIHGLRQSDFISRPLIHPPQAIKVLFPFFV